VSERLRRNAAYVEAGTADLKLRATGERSQAPLAGAAGAAMDLLATAP
jgi:hypothetical protein